MVASFRSITLQQAKHSEEPEKDGSPVIPALEKFLEEYSGARLAPLAWLTLAQQAWREGNQDKAQQAFTQVLEIGGATVPQQALAKLGLAKIQEKVGDFAKAKQLYETLSGEEFSDIREWHLGRVAMAMDQNAQARKHFEAVTQMLPPSALASQARQMLQYIP